MLAFLLFVVLVVLAGKLRRQILAAQERSRTILAIACGVLAWSVLIAFCLTCWNMIDAIVNLSVYAVFELAAILVGSAFLYRYIITVSDAGSVTVLLREFFTMLLFRFEQRMTDDIFEEVERQRMQRAVEDEILHSSLGGSEADDHRKHFGI